MRVIEIFVTVAVLVAIHVVGAFALMLFQAPVAEVKIECVRPGCK